MKDYRIFSKIIIAVSICFIIAIVFNFFTGIMNPKLNGFLDLVLIIGLGVSILATVISERARIKKDKIV